MKKIIFFIILLLLFSFPVSIFSQIKNETANPILSYSQNTDSEITSPEGLSLENVIEIGIKNNLTIQVTKHSSNAEKATFFQNISPPEPQFYFENEGLPGLTHFTKNFSERHIGIIQNFDFPLTWYMTVPGEIQCEQYFSQE